MAELRPEEELHNLSRDNFAVEIKLLDLMLKDIEKRKSEPGESFEILENEAKMVFAKKEEVLKNLKKIGELDSDEYSYKAMDEAVDFADGRTDTLSYISADVAEMVEFYRTVVDARAYREAANVDFALQEMLGDSRILDLLINCSKKVRVANMAKVRAYGLQEVFGLDANKLANSESKALKVIAQIPQEEYEEKVFEEIKKFSEQKYVRAEKINQLKAKAQKVIKILKGPAVAAAAVGGVALFKELNMDEFGMIASAVGETAGVAVLVSVIEKIVSPKSPEEVKIAIVEKYLNDVLKSLGYREKDVNKNVEPEK